MVFDFSVFRLSEPCRAVVDTGDNDNDRMKRHGKKFQNVENEEKMK